MVVFGVIVKMIGTVITMAIKADQQLCEVKLGMH